MNNAMIAPYNLSQSSIELIGMMVENMFETVEHDGSCEDAIRDGFKLLNEIGRLDLINSLKELYGYSSQYHV